MSLTHITNDNIISMASSKLTGTLPVMDGSNLTGVDDVTKSASDPATDTNPSGGVGTVWLNTTSGELFSCTDATTDENVWFNVGGGTGDVQPYFYPGLTSGYAQGGGSTRSDVKDKWSFSSDGNATDAGNITLARSTYSGYSSQSNGYAAGGRSDASPHTDIIDKFAYSSDGDSTDVGDLTVETGQAGDASSETHGYSHGGYSGYKTITRWNYSNDSDIAYYGDLVHNSLEAAGTQN